MFLHLARSRSQPRRGLGDLLVPPLDTSLGELRDLDGAEPGLDPRSYDGLNPIRRFPTSALVVGEIIGNRVLDRVGAVERDEATGLFGRLRAEPVAGLGLSLREAEHA
jgi:hypothetical protein